MMAIHLVYGLGAGELDLINILDYYKIAIIHIIAKGWLVLAAEDDSDLGGQSPQNLVRSVYFVCFPIYFCCHIL